MGGFFVFVVTVGFVPRGVPLAAFERLCAPTKKQIRRKPGAKRGFTIHRAYHMRLELFPFDGLFCVLPFT